MLQTSSRLSDFAVGATAGTVCGVAGCGAYCWHRFKYINSKTKENDDKISDLENKISAGMTVASDAIITLSRFDANRPQDTNRCIARLREWSKHKKHPFPPSDIYWN